MIYYKNQNNVNTNHDSKLRLFSTKVYDSNAIIDVICYIKKMIYTIAQNT